MHQTRKPDTPHLPVFFTASLPSPQLTKLKQQQQPGTQGNRQLGGKIDALLRAVTADPATGEHVGELKSRLKRAECQGVQDRVEMEKLWGKLTDNRNRAEDAKAQARGIQAEVRREDRRKGWRVGGGGFPLPGLEF